MSGPLHVDTRGHGPPLVLLHGWAMHSGIWGGLVADLARRHRVHAVDLPGHGFSAPEPSFTIEGVVRSLDAAFAAERSPLTVIGWSLGGQIALVWALAHPERIARLVLVAATPRFVQRIIAVAPQNQREDGSSAFPRVDLDAATGASG